MTPVLRVQDTDVGALLGKLTNAMCSFLLTCRRNSLQGVLAIFTPPAYGILLSKASMGRAVRRASMRQCAVVYYTSATLVVQSD